MPWKAAVHRGKQGQVTASLLDNCVRGSCYRREGRGRGKGKKVRWREREEMSDRREGRGVAVVWCCHLTCRPHNTPTCKERSNGSRPLPPFMSHVCDTQLWCPAPDFPCWQHSPSGQAPCGHGVSCPQVQERFPRCKMPLCAKRSRPRLRLAENSGSCLSSLGMDWAYAAVTPQSFRSQIQKLCFSNRKASLFKTRFLY